MKIGLLTDTHFGLRSDSPAFNDYIHRFYDEVFFPYMEDNNIKTLIHLGDVVDRRKFINFQTLRDFREKFVYRLWRNNIDTHILVGNHDTYRKQSNEVNSMTELFSTYDGQTEPWIYTGPTEVEFDDLKILLLPWTNDENRAETEKAIQDTRAEIVMGHLEISGFQMHRGMANAFGDDPARFDKFDKVMTGHYHHKSDNGTIYYLGAPYEMTWSDYQDVRGFHVFDMATRELTHIQNPFRMYHKIFYNDKGKTFDEVVGSIEYDTFKNTCVKLVVQLKENPYWFDIVMDRLYKVDPFNVAIVEDYSDELLSTTAADTVDQAQDTMTILSAYVDGMDNIKDKKEIQDFLGELYTDAVKAEND